MIWWAIAALVFLAVAALIFPRQQHVRHPEIWCSDPRQGQDEFLHYCEFKLRDA
jgi:hypothetical protein